MLDLRRAAISAAILMALASPGPAQNPSDPAAAGKLPPGQVLYGRHCAACHGANGDGQGLAAAFLYPKPRSFRGGKYRLVSTDNSVPTRDDLQAVACPWDARIVDALVGASFARRA